ncbi:MAG TPA: MCE family protein [Sulfurospirillum arcachonense]|nr:MCE family protein [Sulfurospirillum arcachonense]
MEKRLNYTIVGSFVIGLFICLIAFMFWLGKYGNKTTQFDYYHTYFQESVSGLNIASLVKLRGVEVGRVKKISINKENSEEVEVLLEINKGTPVKVDSYTSLDSQGITGLKYIELKGGSKDAKQKVTSKENIATIISKKSMLTSLFESGESITTKIDDILIRVSTMLSDENLANISNVVDNLASTTAYIDTQKESIDKMFKDITELKVSIEKNINQLTYKSGKFLDHTQKFEDELLVSFKKLGEMSDKAAAASDETRIFFEKMQKEVDSGQFSMAQIAEENLQIINETAHALKDLSIELDETVKDLSDSPSDILYKSRAKNLGPGEGK